MPKRIIPIIITITTLLSTTFTYAQTSTSTEETELLKEEVEMTEVEKKEIPPVEFFELFAEDLEDGEEVTNASQVKVTFPEITNTSLTLETKLLEPDVLSPALWATTTASTVWQIDIKSPTIKPWLPKSLLTVTLPVEEPYYYKKIISFWDSNLGDWRDLPSTTDFDNNTVSAPYPLPFGRFIVRESSTIFEGIATWYRAYRGHYTAFRFLPRGTWVKITNISGSPRHGLSVVAKVNDYGPKEWTGNLIDLEKHSYWHIGMLGGGRMPVRVEVIE